MPGYELLGDKELQSLSKIFQENNSVLISVGYKQKRRGHFLVRDFEDQLKTQVSSRYCQATSSGSAAAYVALKALGVGPGDEVITSAFSYLGVIQAILLCGAKPVIANIDESLTFDLNEVETLITDKTRCLLPVHMMGGAANMKRVMELSRTHQIPVLEDACQAIGATFEGQALGTLGDSGYFSFGYAKLFTSGEGGAVVTNNEQLHNSHNALHNHGRTATRTATAQSLQNSLLGFNFRMSELHAAVGLAQMARYAEIIRRTREQRDLVLNLLGTELPAGVGLRKCFDDSGALSHEVVCLFDNAEVAQKVHLEMKGAKFPIHTLPSESYWHFAGAWGPVLEHYGIGHPEMWRKSKDILDRSVSWCMYLTDSSDQTRERAEQFVQLCKKYL